MQEDGEEEEEDGEESVGEGEGEDGSIEAEAELEDEEVAKQGVERGADQEDVKGRGEDALGLQEAFAGFEGGVARGADHPES